MRTRSVRRAPLVALAAVGALTLGGCGSLPPGSASVIEGTTISRSDVNELADAQCAGIKEAAESGQAEAGATPRKELVQQALALLMDIELTRQYGESEGVDPRPQEVAAAFGQIKPLLESLPEKYHTFMFDTFKTWAASRDVLTQLGVQATGQQPDANNAQALINAGYQQREPWLKTVDIETDPRYGPTGIGWPGQGDPSVSKASSSFAKDAAKDQPDPGWVSALPSAQKCG